MSTLPSSFPWTKKQELPQLQRRNSLLSGLWQAAEAGLVDEELPFSAVTVNLPNLSAPIHTTVQSSKEYVRGSEHVSTHSGISLVSTEKRKALLSTLEDGARYTQRFKDCCRRKYGKLVVAWRILLDPGGNGRVSFVPFCNAARAMGFVNVSTPPACTHDRFGVFSSSAILQALVLSTWDSRKSSWIADSLVKWTRAGVLRIRW